MDRVFSSKLFIVSFDVLHLLVYNVGCFFRRKKKVSIGVATFKPSADSLRLLQIRNCDCWGWQKQHVGNSTWWRLNRLMTLGWQLLD